MRNKILNVVFVIVLLIAIGVSYALGYNSFKAKSSISNETKLNKTKYIGEDKAKEVALNHAKISEDDILDYGIDLDIEHHSVVYEISFESGTYEYEYEVNPLTGEVVSDYKEKEETKVTTTKKKTTTTKKTTTSANKVSKSEAKDIALKHAGVKSSEIKEYEIELDYERGTYIYEIDFDVKNVEYSYDIDANTGKIIKSEKEIDD